MIKSWKAGVALQGKPTRIYQCLLHPTKGKGRWILVAVGTTSREVDGDSEIFTASQTLVEVWDIEKTALMESFITRRASSSSDTVEEPRETPGDDAEMSPAAAIAALIQARQEHGAGLFDLNNPRRRSSALASREYLPPPIQPSPDVRAMIIGTELGGHYPGHRSAMAEPIDLQTGKTSSRGFIVTGSEDERLRYWDFARPERSTILSGPDIEADKPGYRYVFPSEC